MSQSMTSQLTDDVQRRPIRRALVSLYDKDRLAELVAALVGAGVQIVSTGNTAAAIEQLLPSGSPLVAGEAPAGEVPSAPAGPNTQLVRVEELTGFPECLDGRVKTLHPNVHAGLLADLRQPSHRDQLAELGIEPFDLLVSNLYPFTATVAAGAGPDEIVEKIDIGGPAMVRAAAKNFANVAVVTSPVQYDIVIRALAEGGTTLAQRRRLAAQAFADIAAYDAAIARWFAETEATAPAGEPEAAAAPPSAWPAFAGFAAQLSTVLRYGENPHQAAALYTDPDGPAGLAQARQLSGKQMSYNNYVDTDAAWRACHDFTEPTVAIIKHANPCGIATGTDIAQAHRKAHECDPVSAFGGVVAANREVTVELAQQLAPIFTEVIVAPSYADAALEILSAKKNLRVLVAPAYQPEPVALRQISGGLLMQTIDRIDAVGDDPANWRLVAGEPASGELMADLVFAWRAVRSVKSNAILLAKDGASVGVGMGQVNRVDAARLAVARAGAERARGSAAASDAFFPFPDALQVLADAGVAAVVQPGGSLRDEQVIEAARAAGLTLYLTGTRHFYH